MSKRLFSQVANNEEDSKAAIPLSKMQPDLVNGIPLSGEDYLLVVRQQAKQCAKTVVAPPPKVIKKVQLPAHFQFFTEQDNKEDHASDHWRKGYADPFKSYQKHMQATKPKQTHKEITAMNEAFILLYSNPDQKLIIPTFSQHSILRLLEYHINWLKTKDNTDEQFPCIFQLLVYLDPVLTSKNMSVLRDLSRECIRLRSDSTSKAPLNIIISIISDAFGQSDLI
ncbi:survival motor neuron interacting protein 1-domain-containing protein [Mucor mucedo]|uniref:survival motor neuron interacting protein 1-domain-containing protein n=1 Tax=Mucor mucedo TaxID=29922 RepID=UPI00221F5892|nr:survival motor neuron interacting protein 1-domain-containing protein [Mucor mucedo]KAI7891086.1 survival motor neuron interacting protein 1-domain-containing protein [Mucor mucedo]